MQSSLWRRVLVVVSLLTFFVVVAGCGSDDGGPTGAQSNEAPTAVIEAPSQDTAVEEGVEVTLEGDGEDPEEGVLTGDQLNWSSDVDGELGTGETVTPTLTADTSHTITLEVTDSEGASDEASVGISVLPPAGEPLSDEQRAVTTSAVARTVEEAFPSDLSATEGRNPVEELKTAAQRLVDDVPGVVAVQVMEAGSGTVVLQDGVEMVLINNRPLPESSSASSQAESSAVRRQAAAVPPASKEAVAAFVDFGEGVKNDVEQILSEAGYQTEADASFEAMKSYTGLGALYLDTHGGRYVEMEVPTEGPLEEVGHQYAVVTSTETPQSGNGLVQWLANHRELLNSGQVVLAANGDGTSKVGITSKFIREHWSFDGGVVFLHACFVAAEGIENREEWFSGDSYEAPCTEDCKVDIGREPLAAVLSAGADVVVGTDRATNAGRGAESIRFLFDRLVGANQFLAVTPPPRPFPAADVKAEMEARGLDEYTHPGAKGFGKLFSPKVQLVFRGNLRRGILAPSIHYLEIVDDAAEEKGEMTLHGSFPEKEGRVEVAGNEVDEITSWAEDEIVARVPFEGPVSSGKVRVEGPEEIPSNPVPLTAWQGTLSGEMTQCNAVVEGKAEVRFRADIHRRREVLGDKARAPEEVRAYIAPAPETSVEASGASGQDCKPQAPWTNPREIETLTKQEVDLGAPTLSFSRSTFGGFATVHPRTDEIELCKQFALAFTIENPKGPQDFIAPILTEIATQTGQLYQPGEALLGCFKATLDAGSGFSGPGSVAWEEGDPPLRFMAEWSDFVAEAPPTPDTPG